jgi:hypothetical protein
MVRAEMKKANYASVRGPYKYGNNHFPIQNFYLQGGGCRAGWNLCAQDGHDRGQQSPGPLPRSLPNEVSPHPVAHRRVPRHDIRRGAEFPRFCHGARGRLPSCRRAGRSNGNSQRFPRIAFNSFRNRQLDRRI